MIKNVLYIFLLMTPVISQQVEAQSLTQTVAALEPQQLMRQGKLLACGIKIAMIEPPPGNSIVTSQVFINTDAASKIIFQADTIKYGQQLSFESQGPIESAWIRFGEENAIELTDVKPFERNSLSADAKATSVMPQLIQVAEAETRVQIGIKLKSSGSERTFSATTTFKPTDRVVFRECMRELIKKAVLR